MTTSITIALIALGLDSIVVLYAAIKKKWVLLAITVLIAALLDMLIIHLHGG